MMIMSRNALTLWFLANVIGDSKMSPDLKIFGIFGGRCPVWCWLIWLVLMLADGWWCCSLVAALVGIAFWDDGWVIFDGVVLLAGDKSRMSVMLLRKPLFHSFRPNDENTDKFHLLSLNKPEICFKENKITFSSNVNEHTPSNMPKQGAYHTTAKRFKCTSRFTHVLRMIKHEQCLMGFQ